MNCCSNVIRDFNTSHVMAGEVASEVMIYLRPVDVVRTGINFWFQLYLKQVLEEQQFQWKLVPEDLSPG